MENEKQKQNIQITVILKFRISSTLAKMNRNKSAGPDRIVIEILSAYDDFRINVITRNNEICNSGEIRKGFNRSIFVVVPTKPAAHK